MVKSAFLRRITPAFFPIGLVPNGNHPDNIWPGSWMSNGLAI